MTETRESQSNDQWDGTDIEPSYPRKVLEKDDERLSDAYVASYREGDLFS